MSFGKEHTRAYSSLRTGFVIIAGLFAFAFIGTERAQQQEVRRAREERVVTKDGDKGSQKSAPKRDIRVTWSSEGDRVEVKARNIELTADGSDVKGLAQDGYLYVDDERGGVRRRLEIRPDADGKLRRTFSVNGEASPYNAATQEWLSKILVEFLRQSEDTKVRVIP